MANSIFAAAPIQPVATPKKLVCIIDRQVYGTLPAGTLYTTMGGYEACMCALAKAWQENLPILVSTQVLKNLYELRFTSRKTIEKTLKKQLDLLPEWLKTSTTQITEMEEAHKWLNHTFEPGTLIKKFKQDSKFCARIEKYFSLFSTKNQNLQMILVLPNYRHNCDQELLINYGFKSDEFTRIPGTQLQQYFSEIYDRPEKIAPITDQLDVKAFQKLFIVDLTDPKDIFLFGHGKSNIISQMSTDIFLEFKQMLEQIGCRSLGIFSCNASSEKNFEAYKDAKQMLIVPFAAGDLCTLTNVFFTNESNRPSLSFNTYFNEVGYYFDKINSQTLEAYNHLINAASAIHAQTPVNYPWFIFPGKKPIHLSHLMIATQAQQCDPCNSTISSPVQRSRSPGSQVATIVDDHTAQITQEIDFQAQKSNQPLVFNNMKSIFLHAQHINAKVECLHKTPELFPMINVPFYIFEHLDIGRSYLDELIKQLLKFNKTLIIKTLNCSNFHDSIIAGSTYGQPLVLKNCIFSQLLHPSSRGLIAIQSLFDSNQRLYKLHAHINNAIITKFAPIDHSQSQLKLDYAAAISLYSSMTHDPTILKSLHTMQPQSEINSQGRGQVIATESHQALPTQIQLPQEECIMAPDQKRQRTI